MTSIPVPDISVSSARQQYRYRTLRKVIDVDADQNAVLVFLPAPVYSSLTGDVYELPAETIKAVDGFPVPASFRREGPHQP